MSGGALSDHDAAAGLTPTAVTEALRASGHDVEVAALTTEPVGTGQMGSSFRLRLTFAGDPGEVPGALVAKVPGHHPGAGATVAGAYRTEVTFYRQLASTLSVRVPRCWHASMADGGAEFLLLLEDLAPAAQGDQIAGCSVAEAIAAAENLAGLHGPRWCDPTLADAAESGLAAITQEDAAMLGEVLGPMTEVFLDRFVGRVSDADAEVLRRVPEVAGDWLLGRPERFAPVHGDYRLDNLLFGPDGTVTAVDWQTVSLGLPARDLAFFTATSLTEEDRRAHEREVVSSYHRALVAHGVADLPLEQCWDDHRYAMLQAPLIIVLGCAVGAPTMRGDAMFMAMTRRACAAIRDHDPFALL